MPKIEKQGLSIPEMDSQVQGKSISTSNLKKNHDSNQCKIIPDWGPLAGRQSPHPGPLYPKLPDP